MEMASEQPAYRQVRSSNKLNKRGLRISPSGVRSNWLRPDLQSFTQLLKALEAKLSQHPGCIWTEAQVQALEKCRQQKEAGREIEIAHRGYLGAQDTYYVGTIKSIGRIHQ